MESIGSGLNTDLGLAICIAWYFGNSNDDKIIAVFEYLAGILAAVFDCYFGNFIHSFTLFRFFGFLTISFKIFRLEPKLRCHSEVCAVRCVLIDDCFKDLSIYFFASASGQRVSFLPHS